MIYCTILNLNFRIIELLNCIHMSKRLIVYYKFGNKNL